MSTDITNQALNPTVLVAVVGLLGVILGSILNFMQGIIANHYTAKREKEQWERQKIDKSRDKLEEMERLNSEGLSSANKKIVTALMIYKSLDSKSLQLDNKESEIIGMVGEGIAEAIQFSMANDLREQLLSTFDKFCVNPSHYVDELLMVVTGGKRQSLDEIGNEYDSDDGLRIYTVNIDENYRREQFIAGNVLASNRVINVRLSELTNRQRELLIYNSTGDLYKRNSKAFGLYIIKNSSDGKIYNSHEIWKGRFNIFLKSPEEIIEEWAKDIEIALNE